MLSSLALSAVAAMVGAFALPWLFALQRGAHVHLAFAVGILPLILAAMSHFVPVLTRSRAAEPALKMLLLLSWLAGLLAFVQFVTYPFPLAAALAASMGMAASGAFSWWAWRRGRASLDRPHPCLSWYLAALACLFLALAAIVAMDIWPAQRIALKRLHLHLNTLGFVGLTAFGTLQVLLPTVAGRPDAGAAQRLRDGLPFALAGSLLVALGAAWLPWLAGVGLACWLVPLMRLGAAWFAAYRQIIWQLHGAAPLLAAALGGLALSLLAGLAHAAGWSDSVAGAHLFVFAFLFPLLSGAQGHLFPLWLRPGQQTAWHVAARRRLALLGGARALLFLLGGVLLVLGVPWGLYLALAGLLAWLPLVLSVLMGRSGGA